MERTADAARPAGTWEAAPSTGNESPNHGAGHAARSTEGNILVPAFDGQGADGIRRDSLRSGLGDRSVAAAVSEDAQVRRELADRTIYLQTAYRDPKAATARLDEIIARDDATSAARRLASDPAQLGELRSRDGFFAQGKARGCNILFAYNKLQIPITAVIRSLFSS
ncbi:hypothetical protein ABID26_007421 [Mesorhizobium shonense]|uniref:Uncharacterized protein n=1 Tax=Mesorhizobium shonense TaxID=1209948 RepID=A0ABV2I512_9HYPH